jgi:hypothetical protein
MLTLLFSVVFFLYFELEDNGGFSLALQVCMCVGSLSFLLVQMKKKKTRLYWLLAYNLLFFQAYDAKHVKKNIFLPSLDLVDWQTNIRLIGP